MQDVDSLTPVPESPHTVQKVWGSRDAVAAALVELRTPSTPENVVIISFSGHGITNHELVTHNPEPDPDGSWPPERAASSTTASRVPSAHAAVAPGEFAAESGAELFSGLRAGGRELTGRHDRAAR
jgi:hypothetical protein